MRLRKPCEHGRYDAHRWHHEGLRKEIPCPGGEFLADDALVIERLDDRELYRHIRRVISEWYDDSQPDALAVREGEG